MWRSQITQIIEDQIWLNQHETQTTLSLWLLHPKHIIRLTSSRTFLQDELWTLHISHSRNWTCKKGLLLVVDIPASPVWSSKCCWVVLTGKCRIRILIFNLHLRNLFHYQFLQGTCQLKDNKTIINNKYIHNCNSANKTYDKFTTTFEFLDRDKRRALGDGASWMQVSE